MLCFSYAPLRRGAAAGGGRAIVNASRRIDQQFCLLTSGAILSSSLGARSAAYVGPPKPDRTAAITIRLPMSCSSRIGAYPALRLAFLRLDDIGSAVAPLTGFLRSIGRCAPIFFSFQPSIPHDHSPRGAVGSRGVAIQSRSALGRTPGSAAKPPRGTKRFLG
jgi:hypothetical protein